MKENKFPNTKQELPNRQSNKPKLIIKKSPDYKGLQGFSCNLSSEFLQNHPLYSFPLLSHSDLDPTHNPSSFIYLTSSDITPLLGKYHTKSPFQLNKNGEFSLFDSLNQGGLKNSFNLTSFYSQFCSQNSYFHSTTKDQIADSTNLESSGISCHSIIDKQSISESQKALIMNLHRKFACDQADDKHFQSISMKSDISSEESDDNSLELTPEKARNELRVSGSIIEIRKSEDNVLSSMNLELSMMEWDNKRRDIQFRAWENSSKNASLLAESEELDSFMMFQSKDALNTARALETLVSVDAPPEEEGRIRMSVANRLFLNGHTASKQRLCSEHVERIQQIPPKVLFDSQTLYMETTRNYPYGVSPLLRKLVLFEENRIVLAENKQSLVVYSCPAGGFLSTPLLKYCSPPNKSFAFVPQDCHPLIDLISIPILKQLQNTPIKYLSCGYEHIVALSLQGKIYTWGLGSSGCLGHGNLKNLIIPELINSVFHETFSMIDCGGYHTLAITESGQVYSWGRNDVFQCGIDNKILTKDQIGYTALKPMLITSLSGKEISGIACGEAHSLFLSNNGEVFSCGWADEGQITIENTGESVEKVKIDEKIVRVKCGSIFSAALGENGRVYVWGNGEHGELGLGMDIKQAGLPMVVKGIQNDFVIDIVCGESHTIAMSYNKIFGWGKGIVESFEDYEKYPPGSDIICYAPVLLKEVNSLEKISVGKFM